MKEKLTGFKPHYEISTEITNTIGDFCIVKATISEGSGNNKTLRIAHSSGCVDKIETVEEKAINRALSFFKTND